MDRIKEQLARIQQQLSGLNATQKMLAVSLVAIMVMTLLWWGRYAGQVDMEPVLDQSFSADDIARVTAQLASRGISYKVSGDKVLVSSDRKFEALADLGYAQLLPRDTRSGFDEIIKQVSPWDPDSKNRVMWNRAKEMTLSQVIRNFPGVSNAVVIIDPTSERRVGGNQMPSATINITMRGGEKPGTKLVNAAADVVAGSQSNLARGRISVVVDGVSYKVRDKDDEMVDAGDTYLQRVQAGERHFSTKISEHLAYIKGVMVSVSVDLNVKTEQKVIHTYEPGAVQKETAVETTNQETHAAGAASVEPGAGSNTGMSVLGPGAPGGTDTTSEHSRTTFQNWVPESTATVSTPAGVATVVAASVRVPRSYFVDIFKASNPQAKEPDDALLSPLVSRELLNVRSAVKACTGIKADESVSVETYTDTMPSLQVAAAPSAANNVSALVSGHAKEIAVGGLAVVSLFMVSMMVRKSAPAPAVPLAARRSAPQPITANEDVAGEVGEVSPALDGMELDEDAVRGRQMLQQVSTMVDDNPDAAANLIKRWMNRT